MKQTKKEFILGLTIIITLTLLIMLIFLVMFNKSSNSKLKQTKDKEYYLLQPQGHPVAHMIKKL